MLLLMLLLMMRFTTVVVVVTICRGRGGRGDRLGGLVAVEEAIFLRDTRPRNVVQHEEGGCLVLVGAMESWDRAWIARHTIRVGDAGVEI